MLTTQAPFSSIVEVTNENNYGHKGNMNKSLEVQSGVINAVF